MPLKMANVYFQFGGVYHFIYVSVDFIPGKNDEDNVLEEYVSLTHTHKAATAHTLCTIYVDKLLITIYI